MRRTPPLLALLAIAVQLAGLACLAWITGWHAPPIDDELASSFPPRPEPRLRPTSPTRPEPSTRPEPPPRPGPPPRPESARPEPPPIVKADVPPPQAPPEPKSSPVAAMPYLVAPPSNVVTPPYILELAERTTQIVRGHAGGAWLTFGFYPDGNIRMVDSDGGKYEGRAISARADMNESGGERSFSLQIGMAPDGRLQATFSGGIHHAQTVVLEAIVERPLA